MDRADWRDALAGPVRRVAALPYLPVMAGGLLALLAVAELVAALLLDRGLIAHLVTAATAAGTGSGTVSLLVLVLGLLCLSTTLPVTFLGPVAGGITVSVASVLSLAAFQMLTVAGMLAQLIAGYRLGRGGSQALALVVGLPFLVLALLGSGDADVRTRTVLLASLAPVAALAGTARRARRDALENSASQRAIAGTLLEQTTRRERARIARELHDVVAHHISMIAVQAETTRLATRGMPAEGARRLVDIGDLARAALTEMRRLLGVLREDTPPGAPGGTADRQPQPGLRQLNELLDAARDASGTAARLIVRGPPETLDPGVELTAYRIVQESLTNARRHAPGAAVDVEVQYCGDTLRLRVRDNGPGPAPTAGSGGHGLLGMHERAAAVGGRVRTGPAVGGGFLVEVSLPATTEGLR